MVTVEHLREWLGTRVVDREGQEIGEVVDFYYDVEHDEEAFAIVKGGFLGRHRYIVPLDGATAGRNFLRPRWSKETIAEAEIDEEALATTDEETIYRHYELPYEAPANPTGRRLVRR